MDQQIPDARIIDWAGQRCRHDLLRLRISGEFLGQGGCLSQGWVSFLGEGTPFVALLEGSQKKPANFEGIF